MLLQTDLGIFFKVEWFPNDVAVHGVSRGVIYAGVERAVLAALLQYTTPCFGILLEHHQILECREREYLDRFEEPVIEFSEEDDTVLLCSRTQHSHWLFRLEHGAGFGSVGRVIATPQKIREAVLDEIDRLSRAGHPRPERPVISGSFLQIPTQGKKIVFSS